MTYLDKEKYRYIDPDELPEDKKQEFENISASWVDIQYVRKGIHHIIDEIQKIRNEPIRASCQTEFEKIDTFIGDFQTVNLINGNNRPLSIPRQGKDGYEQRIWDRFSFKGWQRWGLGFLAFIVTLLTIITYLKQLNIL